MCPVDLSSGTIKYQAFFGLVPMIPNVSLPKIAAGNHRIISNIVKHAQGITALMVPVMTVTVGRQLAHTKWTSLHSACAR